MLRIAIICAVLALVAAVLGFGGIAAGFAAIAKIAFYLLIAMFVIAMVVHLFNGTRV